MKGFGLLCFLLVGTLSSCARGDRTAHASQPNGLPSVAAIRVIRADLSGAITLTGEFVPFQEVDVMAKVAGYVRTINVDVGDRVHQGQLLATLEIPEMEDETAKAKAAIEQASSEATRAEDQVRQTESSYEMAHLYLTRIQTVAQREKGLVPQQEIDQVKAQDLEVEAQVSAAKNNLAAARERVNVLEAEEARLKTMRNYQRITAPFEGVVTKRYANTGAMIQAGTASQTQAMPIVRVSENHLLRLILPLPESAVPDVSLGQRVRVRVPTLNRTFTGRVARFTEALQLSTRTMDTQVDVPNPTLAIIPGMYAEVDVQLRESKGVLVAPPDAIDGTGANTRVFEIDPQGAIHVAPVQLGIETARQVEIKRGVEDGALLVAGRRAGLKEGDRVRPVPAEFINAEKGN